MKIKRHIHVLLIILLASACSSISKIQLKDTDDGFKLLTIDELHLSMRYYGDYWFRPFTKKYIFHWNKPLTQSINNGKVLYAAYTFIDPYYSTIGVVYKNAKVENVVKTIASELKSKLYAKNLTDSTEAIGVTVFTKLSYDLPDPIFKIRYHTVEYYCALDKHVFRVVFWTTDTRTEEWFDYETKTIMETIKIDD